MFDGNKIEFLQKKRLENSVFVHLESEANNVDRYSTVGWTFIDRRSSQLFNAIIENRVYRNLFFSQT